MYIEIVFNSSDQQQKEILTALFSEEAEGFEETEQELKVIFKASLFNAALVQTVAAKQQITYTTNTIQQQNWNALWESNFEPVIMEDFVVVRADFHEPVKDLEHEIIIMPKMSFGTGHHATTYLMMQQMRQINFGNKSVFDFGTGTGILAILAKKLGAAKIIATDIDKWSIENAKENFQRNNIEGIELIQSSSAKQGNNFDVILANINKNILMATIPELALQLEKNGTLLLSGLLVEDEKDIMAACEKVQLKCVHRAYKNKWICLNMSSG